MSNDKMSKKLTLSTLFDSILTAGSSDFNWYNIPEREKIYPITMKCTQWPQNVPNSSKKTKWPKNISRFSNLGAPKFTQIGILGLKIKHMATLPDSHHRGKVPTTDVRCPPQGLGDLPSSLRVVQSSLGYVAQARSGQVISGQCRRG
jgi:hypothetical protein